MGYSVTIHALRYTFITQENKIGGEKIVLLNILSIKEKFSECPLHINLF